MWFRDDVCALVACAPSMYRMFAHLKLSHNNSRDSFEIRIHSLFLPVRSPCLIYLPSYLDIILARQQKFYRSLNLLDSIVVAEVPYPVGIPRSLTGIYQACCRAAVYAASTVQHI